MLKRELEAYRKNDPRAADEARYFWLKGKIERQRIAINNIQRKGWQATYIIEELSLD